MIVSELMTVNVASVGLDQTLADAVQHMWDRNCGAIPVVHEDRVVGMLTDRDICIATWSRGIGPGGIRVADMPSRRAICCAPDDTLAQVESIMGANQIRRVPVVDSAQKLLGVLSLADIARAADIGPSFRGDSARSSDGLTAMLSNISASSRSSTALARPRSAS